MRPFRVVAMPPLFADGAHFGERGEHPRIEHRFPEAAVETFDVGILVGLAGFDVGERDAVRLAPRADGVRDELWAVVAA